ncbi:metallophosphoesterase [Terriglobus tenax]|uniref:metallophosphoesterase n=1 Tax=Terriglobus tenax TaxID=1111115 RepID=UPI0021DFD2A5|nr:metallophosphoesterase [Terriglobus tenax]
MKWSIAALLFTASALQAQDPLLPEFVRHVSPAYREAASQMHVTVARDDQNDAIETNAHHPDAADELVIRALGNSEQGVDFLLRQLDVESSAAKRQYILLTGLGRQIRDPKDAAMRHKLETKLQNLLEKETDSNVVLETARDLRRMQWGRNAALIAPGIARAEQEGNRTGASLLQKEADDWLAWDEQINLPTFLRTPPPVFQVVPADVAIRVLAIGDFGTGNAAQMNLASTMRAYHQKHPFSFGITLGDNFYPRGVSSPQDEKWDAFWEQPYGPMKIRFYPSLGNHDYLQADGPAAEVLYSNRSKTWTMPATFYTYTAGPVQFFAIDTQELSDTKLFQRQVAWLDAELAKSTARWKVVYGHYQIYSATRGDEQNLIHRLLPVLRNRVDLYLCGHDHNMQQLRQEAGVHFFLSGGGGASLYDFRDPNYPHSIFKAKKNGFTVIEADSKSMKIQLIGTDGEPMNSAEIH